MSEKAATPGGGRVSASKLVDVQGITKIFRSKILRRPSPALEGLDLAVEEGEIFGFLGPNGAGKTTTIRILLGLIRPSAGVGHVLGRPFGSVEARREVGFLPDSPNFYRSLTARELLRFSGRLHGWSGRELDARIEETLDRVGLAGEARARRLHTYSRGMLQRTGIAAAILHRPRLVILDEPMNGLDPLGRHDFRDLILALREEGVTVFLSSHVLGDVESTADRVGILDRGRLIRCGSLREILEGDGRRIELVFELPAREALPEPVRRLLREFRVMGTRWVGEVDDSDAANRVVREVLAAGGRLVEMGPKRITLEEFFVRQVARSVEPARPEPDRGPEPAATPMRSPRERERVRA